MVNPYLRPILRILDRCPNQVWNTVWVIGCIGVCMSMCMTTVYALMCMCTSSVVTYVVWKYWRDEVLRLHQPSAEPDAYTCCSICMDDMTKGVDTSVSWCHTCRNTFHTYCARTWHEIKDSCPICRTAKGVRSKGHYITVNSTHLSPNTLCGDIGKTFLCVALVFMMLPYILVILVPLRHLCIHDLDGSVENEDA